MRSSDSSRLSDSQLSCRQPSQVSSSCDLIEEYRSNTNDFNASHASGTLALLLQEHVEDQQEPMRAWHLFQGGYIASEACGAFIHVMHGG